MRKNSQRDREKEKMKKERQRQEVRGCGEESGRKGQRHKNRNSEIEAKTQRN